MRSHLESTPDAFSNGSIFLVKDGSIVLRENLFLEARNSILLRSSHETLGQSITYAATLKKCAVLYITHLGFIAGATCYNHSFLGFVSPRANCAKGTCSSASRTGCLYAFCVVLFYAEPLVYSLRLYSPRAGHYIFRRQLLFRPTLPP